MHLRYCTGNFANIRILAQLTDQFDNSQLASTKFFLTKVSTKGSGGLHHAIYKAWSAMQLKEAHCILHDHVFFCS